MDALIVGRAIAGIGAIGIYIGVLAIISENITDKERPTYIGLAGAMWSCRCLNRQLFPRVG